MTTATATKTARTNTYAGACSNCGASVAASAGLLGGKVNGKWTVKHTTCGESTAAPKVPSMRVRSTSGRNSRSCPTGGNCSSFGNGRSCGARDCDGY